MPAPEQQTAQAGPVFQETLAAAVPGITVLWRAATDSTNSELRRLLLAGRRVPTLLYTDLQREGRGTRGRVWLQTRPGLDLAMTLATPLPDWLRQEPRLGLLLAAQLAGGIEETAGVKIGLKWPNDLLAQTQGSWRKVGGLLLETLELDGQRWALTGMGVNVNSSAGDFPGPWQDSLTTLADAAGRRLNLEELQHSCSQRLHDFFRDDMLLPALLEAWRTRDKTGGTPYELLVAGGALPVTAEGVDLATGALRCRDEHGAVHLVYSYSDLRAA